MASMTTVVDGLNRTQLSKTVASPSSHRRVLGCFTGVGPPAEETLVPTAFLPRPARVFRPYNSTNHHTRNVGGACMGCTVFAQSYCRLSTPTEELLASERLHSPRGLPASPTVSSEREKNGSKERIRAHGAAMNSIPSPYRNTVASRRTTRRPRTQTYAP